MITRVKGTYDLLDTAPLQELLQTIRRHVALFGYQEIVTPILEPLELFVRSLGDQTDVVSKEMYRAVGGNADQVHEQSDAIALRPELTASMVRAVVQDMPARWPLKVYSIGPCFRHERPQKGRWRQFTQASIELMGSTSYAQDVLFLYMLNTLFTNLLQGGFVLTLNFLGSRQDRAAHRTALVDFLHKHTDAICATCQTRAHTNPLRVFDCKQESCQTLYRTAPVITDFLGAQERNDWQALQTLLLDLGVSHVVQPRLVRGLDYYTHTVFEFIATDGLGSQNTFCGGGRYERLAQEIGAPQDIPSLGAGVGIERLLLLVQERQQGKPKPDVRTLTCVVPLSPAQQPLALHITSFLINHGITCDTVLETQSAKSMFKYADSRQARYVVIIGEDEQAAGTATVKDMVLGTQSTMPQRDLAEYIRTGLQA